MRASAWGSNGEIGGGLASFLGEVQERFIGENISCKSLRTWGSCYEQWHGAAAEYCYFKTGMTRKVVLFRVRRTVHVSYPVNQAARQGSLASSLTEEAPIQWNASLGYTKSTHNRWLQIPAANED